MSLKTIDTGGQLRKVLAIVIAHRFYGLCSLIRDIFTLFKTIQRKLNLAIALGKKPRKVGVIMHFSEIMKL